MSVAAVALAALLTAGCSENPEAPELNVPSPAIDATDGDYHDQVVVTWDSIPRARSYSVYRSDSAESGYVLVADGTDGLDYHDSAVAVGEHYFYRAVGYDSSGRAVDSTAPDWGFASHASALPAPANLRAGKGESGNSIRVSWEPVAGTAYYKVLRGAALVGAYVQVGDSTTRNFFDDGPVPPGPWYFKVSAYTSDGVEGTHSNADLGYRSATHREFFLEHDKTVVRSNDKNSSLGEWGHTIIAGDISGTCEYETEVSGMNAAKATITYVNYCDYYLVLTGSIISDTDWGGSGKLTGTLNVTGIYEGYVEYHLSVKDKDASDGYYRTCQTGKGCEDILYASLQ